MFSCLPVWFWAQRGEFRGFIVWVWEPHCGVLGVSWGEGRIPAGSVAPEDWKHGARRVHSALPSHAWAVAAFRVVFVQVRLLIFQRSCWCDAFVLCIVRAPGWSTEPTLVTWGRLRIPCCYSPCAPRGLTAGHVARRLCPGPGSQLRAQQDTGLASVEGTEPRSSPCRGRSLPSPPLTESPGPAPAARAPRHLACVLGAASPLAHHLPVRAKPSS